MKATWEDDEGSQQDSACEMKATLEDDGGSPWDTLSVRCRRASRTSSGWGSEEMAQPQIQARQLASAWYFEPRLESSISGPSYGQVGPR